MRAVQRFAVQTVAALTFSFVACSDATAPELGPTEVRGFVATSSANPAVNEQVTVTFGVRRGSTAALIGSVSGAVTFDATAYEFVAENHPANAGSAIAMHVSSPGVLSFAAASADGFAGENIAAVTMKVLKTGATASLAFTISEMTNVDMETKTP